MCALLLTGAASAGRRASVSLEAFTDGARRELCVPLAGRTASAPQVYLIWLQSQPAPLHSQFISAHKGASRGEISRAWCLPYKALSSEDARRASADREDRALTCAQVVHFN
jgi:hypothetical protein